MSTTGRIIFAALAVGAIALVPESALAYGGPGSVISSIGTVLAAVVAILASLFGFVWFPLKRLYQTMTGDAAAQDDTETTPADA